MPDIRLPASGEWISIRWQEPFDDNSVVSRLVPVDDILALTWTVHGAMASWHNSLQIAEVPYVGGGVEIYVGWTLEGLLLLTSSSEHYDFPSLEVGRLTPLATMPSSSADVVIQEADAGNYEITTPSFFASEANSPRIKIPDERWLLVQMDFRSGTITDSLHIIDGEQLRSLEPSDYGEPPTDSISIAEIVGITITGQVAVTHVSIGRTKDNYLLVTTNSALRDPFPIRLYRLAEVIE